MKPKKPIKMWAIVYSRINNKVRDVFDVKSEAVDHCKELEEMFSSSYKVLPIYISFTKPKI